MAANYTMDTRDIKALEKYFKDSPKLVPKTTANILTSLAFKTREYDILNINKGMIVRNKGFVKSSLRVDKARGSSIDSQVAYSYSIKKHGSTGWQEQQTGKPPQRKRRMTAASRGGNKRSVVKGKYRLKSGNKFYKPEQFQGKSLQNKFYFMMRVLGSRGGGEFLITQSIKTKRGALGAGLYTLKGGKITRIQAFEDWKIKSYQWRTLSLIQLHQNNDSIKIMEKSIEHIIRQYLKNT